MLGAIFSTLSSLSLFHLKIEWSALWFIPRRRRAPKPTHSLTRPGPPSSALQIECVLWSVFRWDIIYIFSLICKPRHGVLHATAPSLSLVYVASVTRSDKHTHHTKPNATSYTCISTNCCVCFTCWEPQIFGVANFIGPSRAAAARNVAVSSVIWWFWE
jgi:hypothetical protein